MINKTLLPIEILVQEQVVENDIVVQEEIKDILQVSSKIELVSLNCINNKSGISKLVEKISKGEIVVSLFDSELDIQSSLKVVAVLEDELSRYNITSNIEADLYELKKKQITEVSEFVIHKYVNDDKLLSLDVNKIPTSLNYIKDVNTKFGKKVEQDEKGWVTKVTYYENETIEIDPVTKIRTVTYDGEVLDVNIQYAIGEDGFASQRETTRRWKKKDGTWSEGVKKNKPKKYKTSDGSAQREGKRRRGNVATNIENIVTGGIMRVDANATDILKAQEIGKPVLDLLDNDKASFVANNTYESFKNAIDNISEVDHPFMGGIPFPSEQDSEHVYAGLNMKQIAKQIIDKSLLI